MPSTFFGLNIGKSGLYTYQGAMNTTAHNISNTDTEGYSRQQVIQQASTPLSVVGTYGMQGSGVDIISIDQVRNQYFDEKYWENNAYSGEYNSKNYYMKSIENYISEVNSDGLNAAFDDFNNALQSLATDAGNLTIRTGVANFGKTVTDYLNYLSDSLKRVQEETNGEIRDSVLEINNLVKQIASLNKQINTIEIRGEHANDLRDARLLLVDKLSEYANVSVSEKVISGTNTFVVNMDGKTAVDGYDYNELRITTLDTSVNQNDMKGMYKLYWKDGQEFDSTSTTLGGKMQALFELRDGNNANNFAGTLESIDAGEEEGSNVVVRDTNVNKFIDLNIPQYDGVITIGSTDYEYSSFDIEIDPDDGSYTYTFHTKKEVTASYNEDTPVCVGESVNYKGIPYYQAKLNEFVRTYAQSFNALHNKGEDLDGNKGIDFFTAKDQASGAFYELTEFDKLTEEELEEMEDAYSYRSIPELDEDTYEVKPVSYYFLTAANITINEAIMDQPGMIACAESMDNGIEDVAILKQIIDLKTDEQMFKQGTCSMYIQTLTAEVGVDSKKASTFAENQDDILASIDAQRMSVSGVDMDEEAMNLVKYQNAYNLSAKVITTMNQIYDKLINYMGE